MMASTSSLSAPNKEFLSKLDTQLTCAICLERYKDPRFLPCQHTYCKKCIDGLPDLGSSWSEPHVVRCPECRRAYQLSGRGACVLPSAFLVNNFLEIGEILRNIPSCPKHNKPNNVYCEKCDELICFKCSHDETHRDHPSDLAEDLLEKHKQQISNSLQPVNEKITEVLEMQVVFKGTEKKIKNQGEFVKKEIRHTVQQHMDRLQDVMSALRQSEKVLLRQAEKATSQKLELHALEQSDLGKVLVQLKSCKEYVEEKLTSQSQYQIQTAKKELLQFVSDAHLKIKVSELHPGQNADTAFKKHSTIITAPNVGSVRSTLNYRSVCSSFSVDIPQCVPVRESTKVSVMASLSESLMPARDLHCRLIKKGDAYFIKCSVDQVAKGHFSTTLKPEQPGLHELIIFIGEVDAPVYVHSPIEVHVSSIAEWREPRLKTFACGLNNPHSVAITDNGKYVIVTESQRNCVTVFSAATGEVVRRFGQHGNRQFENPREVAICDGSIFVLDNNLIQKFIPI